MAREGAVQLSVGVVATTLNRFSSFDADFFNLTHSSENDTGLPSAEELVAQGVDPSTYIVSEYDRMERLRLVRNQVHELPVASVTKTASHFWWSCHHFRQ